MLELNDTATSEIPSKSLLARNSQLTIGITTAGRATALKIFVRTFFDA